MENSKLKKPICDLLLVLIAAILGVSGCAAPVKREVSAQEALDSPENRLLAASGCSYMAIQKVLNGLPQTASDEELRAAWGTKSLDEIKALHGLSASATTIDLYRAVLRKLASEGCETNFTPV